MSSPAEIPERFLEIITTLKRGGTVTVDDVTWLCAQYNDAAEQAELLTARMAVARPVCVASERLVQLRTGPCEVEAHDQEPPEKCACWDLAESELELAVVAVRNAGYFDMLLPDEEEPEAEPEPEGEGAASDLPSLVEVEEPDDDEDDDDLDDDEDDEDEDDEEDDL